MEKITEKTLGEKLSFLNPDNYEDSVSKMTVSDWKQRTPWLQAQLQFKDHPVTTRLADECRKEIIRIKTLLTTKEDMSDLERKSLFREKKVHEIYLALFTKDPTKELQDIEESVNFELQK